MQDIITFGKWQFDDWPGFTYRNVVYSERFPKVNAVQVIVHVPAKLNRSFNSIVFPEKKTLLQVDMKSQLSNDTQAFDLLPL